MSARLFKRRNSDFLKVLRKCTPAQQKALLEVAPDDLLGVDRVLYERIKVNPSVLKRLTPSK